MLRKRFYIGWLLPAALAIAPAHALDVSAIDGADAAKPLAAGASRSPVTALAHMPLSFEPNRGQTDPRARFLARGDGYAMFLTPDGAVMRLRKPESREACRPCAMQAGVSSLEPERPEYAVLRMRVVGAEASARLEAENALPGRSRYIVPARASWKPGSARLVADAARTLEAPHFGRVRSHGIYPGIDLVYYGNQRRLEYDFIVKPGADPETVRLRFEGAKGLRLDREGNLLLETGAGTVVQHAPVVYQESAGERRSVPGRYILRGAHEVGFTVGRYDREKPLVIDPVLSYGTFLGGSDDDEARAIAVDQDGNIIVGGDTESPDFPRESPPFGTYGGSYDGFVTKIRADGKTLLYSTYIGSSDAQGWDSVRSLTLDAHGNVLIAGRLSMDVLFVKLDPAGKAVFAVAFGGTSNDEANGVALGRDGTVFLTGTTLSKDYDGTPDVNEGFPVWPANAYQTDRKSSGDAFVCRINADDPANLTFEFSTYLGGNSFLLDDEGWGVAADAAGNAYVAGQAASEDFPIVGGRQTRYGGHLSDGFFAKVSADGTQLLYSTFLGGGFNDHPYGVAASDAGIACVTGWTNSYDFPTTANSFQPEYAIGDCDPSPTGTLPCADAFVVKVDTNKTGDASFVYSSFLGGHFSDYGYAIAMDADGNAYVTGQSLPYDFPLLHELPEAGQGKDAFVTKINPDGTAILFSTLIGGSGDDKANAIALDREGNIYIAGSTASTTDLPRPGAVQPDFGGGYADAFVMKITMGGGVPVAGDVDGNGQFTIEDVKMGLRIAGGLSAGDSGQVGRGQVASPDGALTIADAAGLARKLAGL